MVEMLVALAIMMLAMTVTFSTFSTVSKAWQRGTALSDQLQRGDFVMEQIVMGLRSAQRQGEQQGFWLEDNGSGPSARDSISWVKTGQALVGEDNPMGNAPHRVRFFITDTGDHPAAAFTAWRPNRKDQEEDFDPETLEPIVLSDRITGFNCRFSTNIEEGVRQWDDDWKKTNEIPPVVELTLYLAPLEKDGEPTALKRCVDIPIVPRRWR